MRIPDGYREIAVISEGPIFRLVRAEQGDGTTALVKTAAMRSPGDDIVEALRHEYALARRLSHPTIAQAIDFVEQPHPALVIEDDGGRMLEDLLTDGPLPVRSALTIAAGIAAGIAELHSHDIVHRDVQPTSVMVASDGTTIRLVDLSSATVVLRQQAALLVPEKAHKNSAYVSPEQTGRTSRPLDYRTDLYSLGVTMFEMLTGELPFSSSDPLELVYEHLAVRPPLVTEKRADLPHPIAEVVERLLEKDPGDRYRSAVGLVRDLEAINDRLVRGLDLDDIELHGFEISTRFQVPDRLFGRDVEVAQLHDWLHRAAGGHTSLVFVHGSSGVGKTSLVEELRGPVNELRGYEAFGKADQTHRESADQAAIGALRDLAQQLLTEDDAQIEHLRRELGAALQDSGAMLTELVPDLRILIPPSGRRPRPDTRSDKDRLNQAATQLLSTVSRVSGPVVLVLDDLQWADALSIDLIEHIATLNEPAGVVIVAVYRDDTIDEDHRVNRLRSLLMERDVEYGDVGLAPLSVEAIGELVAASVGRTVADASPLIELCLQQTGGNPFFARLFLNSLYERGLLELDPTSGAWTWDLDQVASPEVMSAVAGLADHRIDSVSEEARSLLAVLAVLGSDGSADLLERLGISDTSALLRELAAQELIELTDGAPLRWRFAHDRVRERATEMLADEDRIMWHERIGTTLRSQLKPSIDASPLFAVLRHLNAVAEVRNTRDKQLAVLNLDGGRAAMRRNAYDSAMRYFSAGVALLGPMLWEESPAEAFALHLGASDAARLAGEFKEMNRWAELIRGSAMDEHHLVEADLRRILFLTYIGDHEGALDLAYDALTDLGWNLSTSRHGSDPTARGMRARTALRTLPMRAGWTFNIQSPRPTSEGTTLITRRIRTDLNSQVLQIRAGWDYSKRIERLHELPQIRDERTQDMLRVLNEGMGAAYWTDRDALIRMTFKGVALSLRHGNDPTSALFYAFFGAFLATTRAWSPASGLDYADLAVRLTNALGTLSKPGRVRLVRDALIAPAARTLSEIQPSLEIAHAKAMDAGDVAFGTSALMFMRVHELLAGASLLTLDPDVDDLESLLRRHDQERNLPLVRALRQLVHDLRRGPLNGVAFSGPHVVGSGLEELGATEAAQVTTGSMLTLRAMARWLYGDVTGARADVDAAAEHIDRMFSQAFVPMHHLLGILAWTDGEARTDIPRRRLRKHRQALAWFGKHNPAQYGTALLIADAALAQRRNGAARAFALLERVVDDARERSDLMSETVATALAARIAQRSGDEGLRHRCDSAAIDASNAWGAIGLAERYMRGASTTQRIGEADGEPDLDVETVVRASEAIAQEVELDSLVRRLMQVVLQNSGAERAVLLRLEADKVVPEAEGQVSSIDRVETINRVAGAIPPEFAGSVVRLVTRTGEPFVAARAKDDPRLAHDLSVSRRGVRSLLCVPLMNQQQIQGILYLENNQADGAFTNDRLRLLGILSSQAASALEKARLHDRQKLLIRSQDRFVPAQFLEAVGHTDLLDVERGQGTIKAVDILFTDIRAFTSIVERMSPTEAMEFVNGYLAHMEPVVHASGGFIDTYIGDSILALFDAGRDAGVRAAVAMARAERDDNDRRRAAGLAEVHTGFGLNTDEVMMGIVGGASALRATIIGDAVNVASRIQDLTKRYQTTMLLAENTARHIGRDSDVTLRPLERVQLVGKTEPIQVFEVLDALPESIREPRLKDLEQYHTAHASFEECRFGDAGRIFGELLAADPADGSIAVMLARTEELVASGSSADGPPITKLTTK